jgi:FkbM family methyltransferase
LDCFKDSYKEHAVIQVDTININELLNANNMFIIDYMSLDVEGYELEILKQIDFKKYKILYLTVEHATVKKYQEEINSFLLSNGYRLSRHNKWDDEYELAEII